MTGVASNFPRDPFRSTKPLFCYHAASRTGQNSQILTYVGKILLCGFLLGRWSEVVSEGVCKPQVARLRRQSNPLNFKAEKRNQRWLDPLPSASLLSVMLPPRTLEIEHPTGWKNHYKAPPIPFGTLENREMLLCSGRFSVQTSQRSDCSDPAATPFEGSMATPFLPVHRRSFYFRAIIPCRLRPWFRHRSQLWRSLKRVNRDDARLGALRWEARTQRETPWQLLLRASTP